jgi:hypothetical protein
MAETGERRLGVGQAWRAALTHCPAGHPYEGENLYVSPAGARGCRRCRHDQKIRSKARVKARVTHAAHWEPCAICGGSGGRFDASFVEGGCTFCGGTGAHDPSPSSEPTHD